MPILAYLANPLLLSRCDVEICILKLSTSMVSVAPCPGGCSRRPRWPVHLRFALMLSLARGVIVAYEVREPPRPHGRSRSHGSHMRLAFSTSSPAIWLSFCSGADPTGRSSRCCCNSRVGPRLRSVLRAAAAIGGAGSSGSMTSAHSMRRPVAPSCTSNRTRTGDATPCRDEACWLVREVIAHLRYGLRRARTSGIGVVSLHLCIGYPTLVRCAGYRTIVARYLRLRGCHMCAMNRYQDTQNRAANQNIGQTTKRDGSFAGRKAKKSNKKVVMRRC